MNKASIKDFLLENKYLVIFTFVLAIVSYFIKLVNSAYGMDTLSMLVDPNGTLIHWVQINRPGMILIKKFFLHNVTNIYLLNTLGILFLIFSSLLLSYIIYVVVGSSRKSYIFPLIFITSPLWTEQFYFVLQNFEFCFAMSLTVFSVLLMFRSSNYISYIISYVILIFSFTIYQSFILFFIAIIIFKILLEISVSFRNNITVTFKDIVFQNWKYALEAIIATIVSLKIEAMVRVFYKVHESDYLSSLSFWGKRSIYNNLNEIFKSILAVTFPYGNNANHIFTFFLAVNCFICVVVTFFIAKRNIKLASMYLFFQILFFVMSVSIIFITAGMSSIRSFVPTYCFVLAGMTVVNLFCMENKTIGNIFLICIAVFSIVQYKTTQNYLETEQITFNQDIQKVNLINSYLYDKGLQPDNYKLMIVGYWPTRGVVTIDNEMIGESLFKFGDFTGSSYATSQNVISLMHINGYNWQYMSEEEYSKLVAKYYSSMNIFPNDNCIIVDRNVIILKIS